MKNGKPWWVDSNMKIESASRHDFEIGGKANTKCARKGQGRQGQGGEKWTFWGFQTDGTFPNTRKWYYEEVQPDRQYTKSNKVGYPKRQNKKSVCARIWNSLLSFPRSNNNCQQLFCSPCILANLSETLNACPSCLTANPLLIDIGRNMDQLLSTFKV